MTTVLVVEDDASSREALVAALRFVGYSPLAVSSGRDALAAVRVDPPDLVVVDMGLPDMSGTDVVVAIREVCDAPILVVSGSRRTSRKADALDAGADDFLDKPFDARELRARLRAVERRLAHTPAGRGRLQFGDLDVDPDGRRLRRGEAEIQLTDIEWRVLDALVSDAGRVVTHRRLAVQVWGPAVGTEVHPALRVHIGSLRRKLGDHVHAPLFIRAETGVGYRWIAPTLSSDDPAGTAALIERATALREECAALRASTSGEGVGLDQAEELAEELVRVLTTVDQA